MNYQEAIEYLHLTHVIEPTYADPETEDALAAIEKAVADLQAALEALGADERKFVTCYREAADSYVAICNFCGASHNDEYQIEHEPDCAIEIARAALAGALGGEAGDG